MVNSEQKVSVSTFVQTLLYKYLLCGGLVQLISVEARLCNDASSLVSFIVAVMTISDNTFHR